MTSPTSGDVAPAGFPALSDAQTSTTSRHSSPSGSPAPLSASSASSPFAPASAGISGAVAHATEDEEEHWWDIYVPIYDERPDPPEGGSPKATSPRSPRPMANDNVGTCHQSLRSGSALHCSPKMILAGRNIPCQGPSTSLAASSSFFSLAPTCPPGSPPADAKQSVQCPEATRLRQDTLRHHDRLAPLAQEPDAASGPLGLYRATLTEAKAANAAYAAVWATAAEAVARAAAAKRTAKKTQSSPDPKERARHYHTTTAAHIADATRKERAAEEQHNAVLVAGRKADKARLRAMHAVRALKAQSGLALPLVHQLLENPEAEREFLARHPRWRQEFLSAPAPKEDVIAHETTVSGSTPHGGLNEKAKEFPAQTSVIHSGYGGVGKRRQGACCFGFQPKCNVQYSQRCSLVASYTNGSLQSLTFKYHSDQVSSRSIMLSRQAHLRVKGRPNGTVRIEMELENGQYAWLWDVTTSAVANIVSFFRILQQMPEQLAPSGKLSNPRSVATDPGKGHPLVPKLRFIPVIDWGSDDKAVPTEPINLLLEQAVRLPSSASGSRTASSCWSTSSCAYTELSSRSVEVRAYPLPSNRQIASVIPVSPLACICSAYVASCGVCRKTRKNMRTRRADIQDQIGIGERVPKCSRAVSHTRSYAHKFMHSVHIRTCTRLHIFMTGTAGPEFNRFE
jgi:hypothetical protein